MCADLVDKYISNIFPRQANNFEHVDVLCGLGTTLYNLPPCGTVNTISGNLGLQIFKNFLTRCQPWWHLARLSPIPKCAWEFSRKFLGCALAKLCRLVNLTFCIATCLGYSRKNTLPTLPQRKLEVNSPIPFRCPNTFTVTRNKYCFLPPSGWHKCPLWEECIYFLLSKPPVDL